MSYSNYLFVQSSNDIPSPGDQVMSPFGLGIVLYGYTSAYKTDKPNCYVVRIEEEFKYARSGYIKVLCWAKDLKVIKPEFKQDTNKPKSK